MKNRDFIIGVFFALSCLTSCIGKKAGGAEANTENESPPVEEARYDTLQAVETQATHLGEKPETPLPTIAFKESYHDFGTIEEGEKVSHEYPLTNTGEAPLIIQSARPSCGCTVSAWSKNPIPVGGTGFVKVEFDSKGKPNVQNKTVTVTANTWPKTSLLHFKVMVTPKSKSAN